MASAPSAQIAAMIVWIETVGATDGVDPGSVDDGAGDGVEAAESSSV